MQSPSRTEPLDWWLFGTAVLVFVAGAVFTLSTGVELPGDIAFLIAAILLATLGLRVLRRRNNPE